MKGCHCKMPDIQIIPPMDYVKQLYMADCWYFLQDGDVIFFKFNVTSTGKK